MIDVETCIPHRSAPYRMTPLELAGGLLYGNDREAGRMPRSGRGRSSRQTIEEIIRLALENPPCVVSFSGGRDSSAVLAVATHVARREGLPLPIPVTLRFPECVGSDESEWQESVVAHLGLGTWEKLAFTHELDAVGPYAQQVLRHFGPLWPFNAHFHLPIMERAVGGSILSGFGGDELFGTGYAWHRVNLVLSGAVRPGLRDLLKIGIAYGPAPARTAYLRRRYGNRPPRPWLRTGADEQMLRLQLQDATTQPVAWDRSVRDGWWALRYRRVAIESRGWLAQLTGVALPINPLAEAAFLHAVAEERGRMGYRTRTEAMHELVGDLLPEPILRRQTKSNFDDAFRNRHLRAFAEHWDGSGVDTRLVKPDVLRRIWIGEGDFDARTLSLAQAAWTETQGRRSPGP